MSNGTAIEWTDATWNPVVGCTKVSTGCANCYAARLAATRLAHQRSYAGLAYLDDRGGAHWSGEVRYSEVRLTPPLDWRQPRRVFVCSMGDLFHESVPLEFIARVFNVMACATLGCGKRHEHEAECWTGRPHTFQVLTKRPERMHEVLHALPDHFGNNWPGDAAACVALEVGAWPLPNVWLGVTAENQETADERIPMLINAPAAVRFVSCEPLLGPVDLTRYGKRYCVRALSTCGEPALHWVICGGETGPGARPMDPDWARSLRDQCQGAGVPFFMKKMGGGRAVPDDLMVREWPGGAR